MVQFYVKRKFRKNLRIGKWILINSDPVEDSKIFDEICEDKNEGHANKPTAPKAMSSMKRGQLPGDYSERNINESSILCKLCKNHFVDLKEIYYIY